VRLTIIKCGLLFKKKKNTIKKKKKKKKKFLFRKKFFLKKKKNFKKKKKVANNYFVLFFKKLFFFRKNILTNFYFFSFIKMNKAELSYSLSGSDISYLLNDKVTIFHYSWLEDITSVSQLLTKGSAVILYPSSPGSKIGHWTALFNSIDRDGTSVVEFYDPLGLAVDKEFAVMKYRQYPFLSSILLNTNKPKRYNDLGIQEFCKTINTCGRHVALRILNKHLSLDDYTDIVVNNAHKMGMSVDEYVTYLSSF